MTITDSKIDVQPTQTPRRRTRQAAIVAAAAVAVAAVGVFLGGLDVRQVGCPALMARAEVVDLGMTSPSPAGPQGACDYAAANGYTVTGDTAGDIYVEWLTGSVADQLGITG